MSLPGRSQADVQIMEESLCRQVNISDAVQEILTFILKKSFHSTNNLYLGVHVKSTKKEPFTVTWFNIKISTTCRIQKEELIENRFPHLCELLQRLQSQQAESHLCLQYPRSCDLPESRSHEMLRSRSDGLSGSTLENLLLVDGKLCTLEQQQKSKQTSYYTFYLRVHQELWQMSAQCSYLHNFMLLAKIFRVNDEFNFSMQLGEVMSSTDFRLHWRRGVSADLPEVVTDPNFYLNKRNVFVSAKASIHSSHVMRNISRQLNGGEIEILKLHVVGLSFPLDEEGNGSSYVDMTLFGQMLVPCKCNCSSLQSLLETLDWDQFGLKFVSSSTPMKYQSIKGHCYGELIPKKPCLMDRVHVEAFLIVQKDSDSENDDTVIKYVIEELKSDVVKAIEEMLQQLLQPVVEKMKKRSMVDRSIKSVCKGVTDVVSMSSSDSFHSTILDLMKVSDTIELGKKLTSQLKMISSKMHSGMWGKTLMNDNVSLDTELPEDQTVPCVPITLDTHADSSLCTLTYRNPGGSGLPEKGTEDPELDNRTAMQTVIQHADLVLDQGIDSLDDNIGKEGNKSVLSFTIDNGIYSVKSNTNLENKELSPFSELAAKEEADFFVDKTPEITQLTKSMKEVSPFQELAFTDEDAINELFGEDPFKENLEAASARYQKETEKQFDLWNISQKPTHNTEIAHPLTHNNEQPLLRENHFIQSKTNYHKVPGILTEYNFNHTENHIMGVNTSDKYHYTGMPTNIGDQARHSGAYKDKSSESSLVNNESDSLFNQIHLHDNEKQVDELSEDSDDWFNDILIGVDHWLK